MCSDVDRFQHQPVRLSERHELRLDPIGQVIENRRIGQIRGECPILWTARNVTALRTPKHNSDVSKLSHSSAEHRPRLTRVNQHNDILQKCNSFVAPAREPTAIAVAGSKRRGIDPAISACIVLA